MITLTFLQASGLEFKLIMKHFATTSLWSHVQEYNATQIVILSQVDRNTSKYKRKATYIGVWIAFCIIMLVA